ncbi:MAG: tRNA epoxyqueuosine(34) reductase QueG [Candidatus Omnitrophica bacterium]|nr:tRNA epoxyqueuosine(34) reductase QueG [Candidatus Omnitrophota bacterium]
MPSGQGPAEQLTLEVKREALRLGFASVGIAPPAALTQRNAELARWIVSGFSGRMTYMEKFLERQEKLLAGFQDLRSLVVLAVSYQPSNPSRRAAATDENCATKPSGRVARYAWGRDYHKAIRKRLKHLEAFLKIQRPGVRTLASVDTAPLPERALAQAAGLGFFGKNTCLIRPKGGSYFFLSALLTNLELTPDKPISWDCGACTLCLQACPTQALAKPYELDARRCIAYLTIELRGPIEPTLRPLVGRWLFGCDICQEVCPYNAPSPSRGTQSPETGPWSEFNQESGAGAALPLNKVLGLRSEEDFLKQFAGTPLTRPKREGLLRNACTVAGNLKEPSLVNPLKACLEEDPSALVRDQAAWALNQIASAVHSAAPQPARIPP